MLASRLPPFVPLGAVGLALLLTQAGCPGGAELENAEQWSGILGTGGTAGTGGSGGGAVGGSGGMAPVVLDPATVDCGALDAKAVIGTSCEKNTGCHKGAAAGSSLVFSWDAGFAARLKDVPAKHEDINCNPNPPAYTECPPPAADKCGTGKLLVNSKDPASSWILTKLHGMQAACGSPMPPEEELDSPEEVACVEAVVNAIAALK